MATQVHNNYHVPFFAGHVEKHSAVSGTDIFHHGTQSAQPIGTTDQLVGGDTSINVAGHRDGFATQGADLVDHSGDISSAATMSSTTTVAPDRAKPIASTRPSPATAPVTTATFTDKPSRVRNATRLKFRPSLGLMEGSQSI
uniref:B229_F1_30 n=1 Tax=Mycobacterium leprae TaxID=1769 RepID=Q49873_MYCLR|nr:B229_F1_30 [Mycobacterium leprae]